MAKLDRPTIIAGNDTTLYIRLREFIEGEYFDFDLTQVSDLKVELLCAKDNYHYEIPYKIDTTYKNLIICDLKHTYYHSNTSYGIRVTGTNEDGKHWTWCMMPREGFLVVSNTSGLHLTDEAEQLSYNGLVGWGISYNGDLTNYYTKSEVDNLIAEIEIDLSDYYTKEEINQLVNQFPTKSEIDTRFNNYYTKTQVNGLISDLENIVDDKQDTLVSGVNIKTINNESILGSGNIDIQGGGGSVEPIIVNYGEVIPDEIIAKISEQKTNVVMYDRSTSKYVPLETIHTTYLRFTTNQPDNHDTFSTTIYTYTINTSRWTIQAKAFYGTNQINTALSGKQDTLVSGVNIKTINNESILGEGNIDIQAGEDYSEQFKTTADALWDLDHRINRSEYITNKKLESIENSTKDTLDEFGDNINEQLSVAANTLIEHSERLAVQSDWNESDSSSLAYIQNKPTISTPVQSDWNESDSSSLAYIQNKPTIQPQVQSDWNQTISSELDFIKNKPTIPDPYVNETNPMYQYFTITGLTSGTLTCRARSGLSFNLYYRAHYTNQWSTWSINSWSDSAIVINAGSKYYIKGTKPGLSSSVYNTQFGGTAQIELSGNLLSLLYGDDFVNNINISINDGTGALRRLFYNHTGIISAKNLVIPVGVYQNRVFEQMFLNCTNLEYGPQLLFTNENNYTDTCKGMFAGCTSLKYLKCTLLTDTPPTAFTNWLQNVAPSGTFIKADNMTQWTLDSASGIPAGWTILNESDLEPSLKYETVTSTTNGLKIEVVSALPSNPSSDTIYIVQ